MVLLLELLVGILVPLLHAIPLTDEPAAERVMALLRSQETWEDEDAYLSLLVIDRDQEQAKWAARRLRKNYNKTEDVSRKTLLIFLHPRQNYKQTYLDFSYGDASKPHAGWVYSHDTRQIARMIYQENESLLTRHRLFYGTDFTYGDFLERHPDRD
ncbi:MAG: hypothetical protein HYY20_08255, partial [Candidatus Tectomicrobia bacterium]|nr:hypothetical protein [Candidatus Tectomicrobia bacterium]